MKIIQDYNETILNDVIEITSLSKSTIKRFVKNKSFPRPIELGTRSRGWIKSEIQTWIENRADGRNSNNSLKG